MTIEDRVIEALQGADTDALKSDTTAKCMEFLRKMEVLGVLKPDRQSNVSTAEGGLEQLKLYAQTSLDS